MVNLTGMLPPALGGEQEATPPPSYEPEMDLNKTQEFAKSIKGTLGLPEDLMEEVEDYVKNPPEKTKFDSPIDAAIDAGYLIAKKISKDKTKYLSGIAEYNPEGNKAIRGMFKNALGADPDWNPTEVAWCATFVSQVLSDLGADPLRSKDRYDRVRADKYRNYGSPVGMDNLTEGDLIVFDFDGDGKGDHVTFYVGDREESNKNPDFPYISVLGGNQGDAVNIREYPKDTILATRRITYNDIDYEFTKELARDNADFNAFLKKEGEGIDPFSLGGNIMDESNRPDPFDPQYSTFDEGGLASKALDFLTSPLTGDYRKEKPTSVQMTEAGLDFTPVGTVDSIVEDPSWSNIALEVAPDLLGLGPAKKVGQSLIKGFKTGRGSTYKVEEGSRTTRERAPDEVGGEVVTQPTSGKTIYMSYDDMERFGLLFQKGEPGLYQFVPIEGQKGKAHLTFAKDYGPNKAGDPVPNTEVSFTTEPKVGDHPVEIYESTNNNRVSIHFGSEITEVMDDSDVWSYPEQLYDSAETSINVSKKPAGYNELKKRGEIKDGDLIVDIGGGKFDNLVDDAAEQGATVKVYDPFNRSPEHNKDVVDSVRDGKADMAMSHNVLNVIQEDKNIIDIARQAENAVKPGGKAHFSVYEGTGKGEGKVTTKGYQRNQKTQDYIPLIEEVFGKGNVTRKGKIITATKKETQGFNQGGPVMNEQMEMAFMKEGGIKDDGMKKDPVSGNEIPPGSMASEVRDDIPAMLSEGEYVVPADVLRFYGVNFFENLRNKAKSGLQNMEANGRIGGEPISQEQIQRNMGYAQGGAVGFEAGGIPVTEDWRDEEGRSSDQWRASVGLGSRPPNAKELTELMTGMTIEELYSSMPIEEWSKITSAVTKLRYGDAGEMMGPQWNSWLDNVENRQQLRNFGLQILAEAQNPTGGWKIGPDGQREYITNSKIQNRLSEQLTMLLPTYGSALEARALKQARTPVVAPITPTSPTTEDETLTEEELRRRRMFGLGTVGGSYMTQGSADQPEEAQTGYQQQMDEILGQLKRAPTPENPYGVQAPQAQQVQQPVPQAQPVQPTVPQPQQTPAQVIQANEGVLATNDTNNLQAQKSTFNPMDFTMVGSTLFADSPVKESITISKTFVNSENSTDVRVVQFVDGKITPDTDTQYTVHPYYEQGSTALEEALKAAEPQKPSSDDDGGTTPPPKPKDPNEWAKEVTDPMAWANENLQGKADSVIDTVKLGTSVARVNAMAIVAEAQGNKNLAEQLRGQAREFVSANPVLNSLPNAWIDGDRIADDLQKDPEVVKSILGQGQTSTAPKPTTTPKTTPAQTAATKAVSEYESLKKPSGGGDDDPFPTVVTDKSIAETKAIMDKQTPETIEDTTKNLERTTAKIEDIQSGKNTSGQVGFKEGGLMATPKKKAKRQYKKGGLANKK